MEFLHIYLLIAVAIFCLFGIIIVKVIEKGGLLKSTKKTFIEEFIDKKKHELDRSRTGISIEQYFIMVLCVPVVLAVLTCLFTDNRFIMLMMVIAGIFVPDLVIKSIKNSEDKKFEGRFVRALSQMASSLHSGMTIELAIDSVINCELLHPTIREDFKVLASKMKLGIPIADAFFEFAEMTDSKDAKDVATAISIMTNIGGDAGVAVEKLQKNIEDRLLYRKKRESMMTESKIIVIASDIVPVLIIAGTMVFMPNAIPSYFKSPGLTLMFVAIIVVVLIGSVIVHRMLGDKVDAS